MGRELGVVELLVVGSSAVLGCSGWGHRRWFWPSFVLLDRMPCRFGWLWVADVGWGGCWCCLRFIGSVGAVGAEWVCGQLESVSASEWRAAVVRVLCLCRRVLFVMTVVSCALVFGSSFAC